MALRITHTNNSDGHDGTYVYRSTATMDPQNLPAPIADEAPVALGEAFEYIDNATTADGTYYFRTQDHQGGDVSAVSAEASITLVSSYDITYVGAYSPSSSTSSVSQTLTVPAETVIGDMLVISITHGGTISFSDGAWTTIGISGNMNNVNYPVYHSFAYLVYDGSFSSVTVSQSGDTLHMSATLASYHPGGGNIQITTLINQEVTLSSSSTAPVPDFTATKSGLVLLSSGGAPTASSASHNPPAGWDKRSSDSGSPRRLLADTPSAAQENFYGLEYYPYGSSGAKAHIFILQMVAS